MALCSNQSEVLVTRKATQGKRFHFFFSNNNYRELVMPDEMMLLNQLSAVGVEPTAYLTDILPRIPLAKSDEELDALLPDRWQPSTALA